MPNKTKTTKTAPQKPAAQKPANAAITEKTREIFEKIQAKTGLSNEKIEKFQKDWLAMPKTRTKYEHLQDAPMVALEEGLAMANDIVDFIQKQPGGESVVFKKMKEEIGELTHDPKHFFLEKFQKAKSAVDAAKKAMSETKPIAKPVKK